MSHKQNLIQYIHGFLAHAEKQSQGGPFSRTQVIGSRGDIIRLTFGFDTYFEHDKVLVETYKKDTSDPTGLAPNVIDKQDIMTVEDAVDALFVAYGWYA